MVLLLRNTDQIADPEIPRISTDFSWSKFLKEIDIDLILIE